MLSRSLLRGAAMSSSKAFSTSHIGPNYELLQMLSQNLEQEASSPDKNAYKVRAFAQAIKAIGALEQPVRSVDEVKKLKGVGVGISNRIDAFLSGKDYSPEASGSSSKARKTLDTEGKRQRMIVQSLTSVLGIGAITANDLVKAGCTSIADLKKPEYFKTLTDTQKFGVNYHEPLQRPVERSHAEQFVEFMLENISSKYDIELVGSYRRGAQTFSNINVLLTHPSHVHIPTPPPPSRLVQGSRKTPSGAFRNLRQSQDHIPFFHTIFPENCGLMVDTRLSRLGKWEGIIRLPERTASGAWEERSQRTERIHEHQGLYVRLDLNLAPMKSKGAALLALTGDREFTIDIRNKAERLGLLLNEYGLWRWTSSAAFREDVDEADSRGYWSFVEGESEAAILRELGMNYVEPIKRNFAYIANSNTDVSTARKKGRPRKNVV